MKGAKITLDNGRRFALVARSGSYAIVWQCLPENLRNPSDGWHPINATTNTVGSPLKEDEPTEGLCCLVRDPVERFLSSCARQRVTAAEGMQRLADDVHFWPLADMGLLQDGMTHFRFPDEIDKCAAWLGLPVPVPQLNSESALAKPTLTAEEEAQVRQLYAADIAKWETL